MKRSTLHFLTLVIYTAVMISNLSLPFWDLDRQLVTGIRLAVGYFALGYMGLLMVLGWFYSRGYFLFPEDKINRPA